MMQKLPLKNLDHFQPKLDSAWVGAVSLSHDAVMLMVEKKVKRGSEALGEDTIRLLFQKNFF